MLIHNNEMSFAVIHRKNEKNGYLENEEFFYNIFPLY